MTLLAYLARLPPNQRLIVGASKQRTVGEMLDRARSLAESLKGLHLGVRLPDPIEGIESLIAADGSATSLTLLPFNLEDQHTESLLALSKCDLLFSESAHACNLLAKLPQGEAEDGFHSRTKSEPATVEETRWNLTTSGTTSTPKLVQHTLATLKRSIRPSDSEGNSARWGLLYDYNRFAGLQVVLQALLTGSELIVPPSNAPLAERLEMLASNGCTHLSATPTLWRSILMSPACSLLALKQVTLGGEIADQRVLSMLRTIFSEARITHIYASTETGVGFSVNDGQAGFPASLLHKPHAGLPLRVVNGMLYVKNKAIRPYDGSADDLLVKDGWINTGDLVKLCHDRYLFLGRASGVINVGGNKVHPEEVEEVLISQPDIEGARVFAKSSPFTGSLVVAEVIATDLKVDPTSFCFDLKRRLKEQLEPYKIPVVINVVEEIATTSTGKISRRGEV